MFLGLLKWERTIQIESGCFYPELKQYKSIFSQSRSHRSRSQVLWAWFPLRKERKSASCCSNYSAGFTAAPLPSLSPWSHDSLSVWILCFSILKAPFPLCALLSPWLYMCSNPLYCHHCEALFANTATHIWGLALWHWSVVRNKAFISPTEFHRSNLLSPRRTPPPNWLISK